MQQLNSSKANRVKHENSGKMAFAGLLALGTGDLSVAADEARKKSRGALSKNDNAWIYDQDIACRYNQGDMAAVLTRGSNFGWLKERMLKSGRVDGLRPLQSAAGKDESSRPLFDAVLTG